jgi:glycine cleavage system H protein
MMPEYLETTVDKFTFKVATDRLYTAEGMWVQDDGDRVRIGLTDYVQQRSGDVAFAEVKPLGTVVALDEEVGSIETVKANISLAAPVAGTLVEINPLLETAPETINADPYGAGWLAVIAPANWAADQAHLLDPAAYFALMKGQAEKEAQE